MSNERIYLQGLNGLRAIAATAVVFSHICLNLPEYRLPGLGGLDAANFGVTIFFSLSGFLITYLLLVEKESSGHVEIGKFYVRRIARIWPLYFFYMLLVLLYFRFAILDERILWYILFTPNVAFVIGQTLPLLGHYWSLGVEEQFYIVWPWIVKYSRRLVSVLVAFVICFILLKLLLKFAHMDRTYAFFHYSRFGCMAIGAIAANLYWSGHQLVTIVSKKWVQLICWILFALVAINRFHIASLIDHEIIAVATVIVILSQVKGVGIFSLEKKWLSYLGKISFGMYVYNPLIIALCSIPAEKIGEDLAWLKYAFAFVVVPIVVVIVSHLSYRYLESWFLHWKTKFAIIKT